MQAASLLIIFFKLTHAKHVLVLYILIKSTKSKLFSHKLFHDFPVNIADCTKYRKINNLSKEYLAKEVLFIFVYNLLVNARTLVE